MIKDYRIPNNRPMLPNLHDYVNRLKEIWEKNVLTNNGDNVKRLEIELKERFEVKNVILVANGTSALQLAIKSIGLKGNVLTTPFSYIATLNSILWEACNPIFCDIDSDSFCVSPTTIEKNIDIYKPSGIILTNVFGNTQSIEMICDIAHANNVKVIFDSSHCFDVKVRDSSIFNFGDLSTLSLHATKIFSTIEGGAIFTKNDELADRLKLLRNFGHSGPNEFKLPGINSKLSELHAAFGLVNLSRVTNNIENRKKIVNNYILNLSNNYKIQEFKPELTRNYSYFPIVTKNEKQVLKILSIMEESKIELRRYFYPSLNLLDFNFVSDPMPISEQISSRILCLPLFSEMTIKESDEVIDILMSIT